MSVTLSNPNASEGVSDVLSVVKQLADQQSLEAKITAQAPLEGKKDGIIVGLLVGVGGSILYDLLKKAAQTVLAHGKPAADEDVVVVDGEAKKLIELQDE